MKSFLLLMGAGLLTALPLQARPWLPETPMGTGSASFAGGGAGHSGGVNSIFDNPAALSIRDALQVETGLMGLSAGLSPYLLFGARGAGNASYALGYFQDARAGDPENPADPRQGLIAGGSWEAFPRTALGASVRNVGTGAGIGLDGFGIDADAGMVARPVGPWRAGLAVRNLMQSGVGREPSGFRTRRGYLASLGAGTPHLRLPGFFLHEPDAYYELRAAGAPPGFPDQAFSLAAAVTPGGRLGFRGTLLLPWREAVGFALGTFLNLPVGQGGLICGYVFHAGGFRETGESGASHSISIHYRLGAKRDPRPPMVEVLVDRVLVPAGDGPSAQVHFRLFVQDRSHARSASPEETRVRAEGRVKEWTLEIRAARADGTEGETVKAFAGRDLPPRDIRWSAEDDQGKPLPAGFYAFRLTALDLAGTRGGTAWQLLEIRAQAGDEIFPK